MPEFPDIVVYLEALEKRILGHVLRHVQLGSPFLLRSATPPISTAEGKKVVELRRLGKRICIGLEEDLWLVLHLMIVAPRFLSKSGGPHNFGIAGTSHFHEGLALVQEAYSGTYGYIDKNGNYVVPSRFTVAYDFSEGVAWVAESDPKTREVIELGWIDKSGKWVLPLKKQGLEAWSGKKFSEGLAAVWFPVNSKGEYRWAYLDHNGNEVINRALSEANEFIGGIARVRISGNYAYIDRTGRIIWQLNQEPNP